MAKIIGLTGGIGAGKTAVSDYLNELGYPIVDTDILAREVVEPGTIGLAQLVAFFGDDILMPDGSLDRKWMRQIVFQQDDKRQVLNAIIHPLVELAARQKMAALDANEAIVLVAPLLYEAGLEPLCDEVWMVTVDPEVQITRIMERDQVDRELAERQVAAQLAEEEKLAYQPIVLRNNDDLPALYRQVDRLLK